MAYAILAYISVGLAVLGLFLPGLPTTPFVLLGAWAASRGSKRLHRWLYEHPRLGPPLRDWERERAVSPRAKLLAVTFLAASWGIMLWRGLPPLVLGSMAALFGVVAAFVVTRPHPR